DVRRAIAQWVAPHGTVAGAIVTAVLIGDRSGLPDEVRTRLQAAGTYHVIAISGGNIAILAAVILLALAISGISGRRAHWIRPGGHCGAIGVASNARGCRLSCRAPPRPWDCTVAVDGGSRRTAG